MRRLALVLAVVLVVFSSTFVVAGPDNEAPYSSHVDPVGEGGSYVPKLKESNPGNVSSYSPLLIVKSDDDNGNDGSTIVGSIAG